MMNYLKKHWKMILGVAAILVLIILLVIGCSAAGGGGNEDPVETTVPVETTIPIEETTVPEESTEPADETTEPREPEETVPPTTETPASEAPEETEPLAEEPTSTEAPKNQHKHIYSGKKKEPTCTSDGSVTYTCSGCGYSYTDKISATGHKWSGWVVTKEATVNAEGTKTRTCGDCGIVETETIAKLPAEKEPESTEPIVTTPPATEPPVTEPPKTETPVTEPAGCSHSWEMNYHPEEGHYGPDQCVCKCGAKFSSDTEWLTHVKSVDAVEALTNHTSYSICSDWIVDSPEYYEWVCSKCGASTTTQP